MKTVHKELKINPHCKVFGAFEYELLAKLMNWNSGSVPINVKEIRVKVELDVEEVEE